MTNHVLYQQGPHLDDQVELKLARRVGILPIGDHPVGVAAERPASYGAHQRPRVAQARYQQPCGGRG